MEFCGIFVSDSVYSPPQDGTDGIDAWCVKFVIIGKPGLNGDGIKMETLERIHEQVRKQLNCAFQTILGAVDLAFSAISQLFGPDESFVDFPEDLPCTIVTQHGSVRLEPIAFAMFRYCWFVYLYEGRQEISFAELGEKIYSDPLKPRSTIQNSVRRGERVGLIGIVYFYSGEYVFIRIQS